MRLSEDTFRREMYCEVRPPYRGKLVESLREMIGYAKERRNRMRASAFTTSYEDGYITGLLTALKAAELEWDMISNEARDE